MVVVLYLFVHVLLMPESGYLGRSTAASVTVTLVLFAAFAVVSAGFWLYFRLRPGEEREAGTPGTDEAHPEAESPATAAAPAPARMPVDAQGNTVPGAPPPLPKQAGPPPQEFSS